MDEESVSDQERSSGDVQGISDNESLLLVCVKPLNWEDSGLIDGAFSKSKLSKCEQSVGRLELMSHSDAMQFIVGSLIARNPERTVVGGLCSTAVRVCSVGANDPVSGAHLSNLFVVKPDPLPREAPVFWGHAAIGFSPIALESRDNKKSFQTAAILNLKLEFMKDAPAKQLEEMPWGQANQLKELSS